MDLKQNQIGSLLKASLSIQNRGLAVARVFQRVLLQTCCSVLVCGVVIGQPASSPIDEKIERLENTLNSVLQELQELKAERDTLKQSAEEALSKASALDQQQQAILEELENVQASGASTQVAADGAQRTVPYWRYSTRQPNDPNGLRTSPISIPSGIPTGLNLGAYGEHHFRISESAGGDVSDIHRFVGFLGYDFADWLHFVSETEVEHAYVKGGDGELSLEQFYVDVNLIPSANLRVGRALHPAGIINRYHEPPTFYGVERPTYSSSILPSTWSIDGVGLWGQVNEWLRYEVYGHAGLDGSKFSSKSGIRGGRIKERPSLHDPGVSGRLDIRPLIALNVEADLSWRLGVSYSGIGIQNGDQAADAGKPDGEVQIFALDTDLRWKDWEWRSEVGLVDNNGAGSLGMPVGVADSMLGGYGEVAYHFWPDALKRGRLENMDAVGFARYSYVDPQHGDVPGGVQNRSLSLRETTFGMSIYPVPNLVFKADYTFADSLSGSVPNRFDFGMGYQF